MYKIKYQTFFKLTVPKLWETYLFCNIVKETEKAYLLNDIVQDTEEHKNGERGLMISNRWIAKSQITEKINIIKKWSYEYDHLLNGRPALILIHDHKMVNTR